MPVPSPNNPCWNKLANGALGRIKTQNLAMQLLVKRLERSPDPASAKATEIHAFFVKWERVLSNEIVQLTAI